MPHLDDIWYVGRARAEGVHGDLDGGQRSSEVKWGKVCTMATIFGQKKPWCKLRMIMTLMEVKGHQRSNGVNYVLWLPYLVKRTSDASEEWWWPWWMSKVIRGQRGKLCGIATIFGSKEVLMQTENDDDLYGGQRSSDVKCGKLCDMATIFGQKNCWCKLRMMMTFMEVKANRGQIQWIIFVLLLWYLVSRWGLGPKVCMYHFGCGNGMNWIKGYYMITKTQKLPLDPARGPSAGPLTPRC